MGSVHFQIVPWSGLYFSRSIGPFLCSQCYLQGFNLLHLSPPNQFPLLILASSVCLSLHCLISALTQGEQWWSFFFFRLTCSVMLWGGRSTANKYHWHVFTVIQPHWVCPRSWYVCFSSLHCSDSKLLCRKLSDAGPGLHALPRSKPLRFRFSGTSQRRRFGWACVLCPSQV